MSQPSKPGKLLLHSSQQVLDLADDIGKETHPQKNTNNQIRIQ